MLKNSSKIISAYEDNFDKFNTITENYGKFFQAILEKESVLKELQKISSSVFKNISTRKVCIGKIKNSNYVYFFSPSGINIAAHEDNHPLRKLGDGYGTVDLNEELYQISHINGIKKLIKKEDKTKYDTFFKNRTLLKNEPSAIMEFKKVLEIRVPSNKKPSNIVLIKNIIMKEDDHTYLECYSNIGALEFSINLVYLTSTESGGTKDKIYIEQMYSFINQLMIKNIKNKQTEIIKIKKFLSKLKESMPEYFMLEAIEE